MESYNTQKIKYICLKGTKVPLILGERQGHLVIFIIQVNSSERIYPSWAQTALGNLGRQQRIRDMQERQC